MICFTMINLIMYNKRSRLRCIGFTRWACCWRARPTVAERASIEGWRGKRTLTSSMHSTPLSTSALRYNYEPQAPPPPVSGKKNYLKPYYVNFGWGFNILQKRTPTLLTRSAQLLISASRWPLVPLSLLNMDIKRYGTIDLDFNFLVGRTETSPST